MRLQANEILLKLSQYSMIPSSECVCTCTSTEFRVPADELGTSKTHACEVRIHYRQPNHYRLYFSALFFVASSDESE